MLIQFVKKEEPELNLGYLSRIKHIEEDEINQIFGSAIRTHVTFISQHGYRPQKLFLYFT